MLLRVLAPLTNTLSVLTALVGLSMLGWLLALLGIAGIGAGTAAANQMPKVLERGGAGALDPGTGGATDRSVTDGLIAPGQEGAGQRWIREKWGAAKRALGFGGSVQGPQQRAVRHRASLEKGARESFDFWLSKGLTREQAAGLVGMEQGESSFDPNARGDGGLAHGAFQHHPNRRAQIMRGTGIDVSNATHQQQLEAAWWEMTQGNEKGSLAAIRRAKTASDAARAGVYLFERPRDKEGEAINRGRMAEGWLQHFNSQGNGSPAVAAIPKIENALQNFSASMGRFENAPQPFQGRPLGTWGVSGTSTTNNVQMEHRTEINVNGAQDPKAVANEVNLRAKYSMADNLRNLKGAVA